VASDPHSPAIARAEREPRENCPDPASLRVKGARPRLSIFPPGANQVTARALLTAAAW